MNISEVKVKLLGSDILSIINEFVKIDGLTLKSIKINNSLIVEGNFKSGISIDFLVKAELIDCINNKIHLRISKVKILNLGMLRMFRSFVLKKLAKAINEYYIESNKDNVIIDVKKILQNVPFVDININDMFMKRDELWVEVGDVNISIAGELIKTVETDTIEEQEKSENDILNLESIAKIEDNYSKGRKILEDKLPTNVKKYKDYIFVLPDIVSLIYRLLKDKRVSIKTKLIMSASIAYITVPTNLIPNRIPFIGVIDDVGVIFFTLNKILNDVPISIIVENWTGKNDIFVVIKNGIEYLSNFTKAQNVQRLYEVIEELSTL
ncbi:YkvA family protein [Clostridium saccharobutylicum]|uniref:DUF1232 domain-containing protein n=1 Tax=Clostridium saccharobutylicum DSM 13864 TaxID=1345695 RepID=U5MZQ5_CLOSA|nr:DUF1232 domain-containing protein [Clostridium saccharobutylicum]AGX44987.1 hypothetical protein CLSA_c40270 [Clostridium saccharobutylicum DSM 13864]AQR92270.1 hypothetical protein CLOSC_40000 [Clostridium saccharobutylicum]AQS02172.1 hypothetical protein CSACC_40050 [Clostridium saccharobutylicum]AQS16155.1 hypothetical protein CLOSACC_40050 [Clostridium saccharobutylicum]MBA2903773.1 uncharacterized membrane protein YkvA (DUF1232 family) [Clostridium saccharobutylicum]